MLTNKGIIIQLQQPVDHVSLYVLRCMYVLFLIDLVGKTNVLINQIFCSTTLLFVVAVVTPAYPASPTHTHACGSISIHSQMFVFGAAPRLAVYITHHQYWQVSLLMADELVMGSPPPWRFWGTQQYTVVVKPDRSCLKEPTRIRMYNKHTYCACIHTCVHAYIRT